MSRCRFVRLAGALLALGLTPAPDVFAGAIDPGHRFESVRIESPGAAEILELPGTNRLLVFLRDGSVRGIVGAELADQLVARVPAETSCASDGILGAAWEPASGGRIAFVSYTASRNSALSVGRLDTSDGSFTEIWNHGFGAPCTNIGGGIAVATDGTVLLGIGDMGQPARAGSASSNLGKLYRMTRDGGFPVAPLLENPLGAASYMYASGIRNPVALAVDSANGEAWFLDQGPATEDELNLVTAGGNYGWATSQQAGPLEVPGIEDPFFTWGPGAGAAALTIERSGSLGAAALGTAIVATAGSGEIISVRANRTDRLASTQTLLFTRDAAGPQSFLALRTLPDGFVHVLDAAGSISRLLPRMGIPTEPSSIDSIVPVMARRLAGGDIEIASERVPGATESGLHVGLLSALTGTGYSHDDSAASYSAVNDLQGDAWTRMVVPSASLGGQSAYFLVSARRDCMESGLGRGTFADRPIAPGGCSVDVLGGGTHDIADVDVSVVITAASRLALPRDLAFHPDVAGQLWVINTADNSAVVIHDTGLPSQRTTWHAGSGGSHFFSQPAALAFGPGTPYLATIHEEDDYTQGPPPGGTPQDFMGPTLWINDSAEFEGGHASHYDMLHNSPNGVGIAWETGNAYWVFDGYHRSLTRYDFVGDHGPGGSDHSDAIIRRHADGLLGYAPGIGSHVQHDPATGLVYAADTANARIVVLDPSTGAVGMAISPNYDGCSQRMVNGSTLSTFIDGSAYGMVSPSGLELWDGLMFVSDNATSRIFAFDMTGGLVDYLDTGFPAGTLMGMSFDPTDGSLCVVDTLMARVLRIRAR